MTDQETPDWGDGPDEPKPEVITEDVQSSEELGELFGALAKAQGSMGLASKSTDNKYFDSRYADLGECIEVARKPLSENALCVIQHVMTGRPFTYMKQLKDRQGNIINSIQVEANMVRVRTFLGHSSGQWMSSVLELRPTAADPQAQGSATSYGRRYAFKGLLNIADKDDDGNAASGRDEQPNGKPNNAPPPSNKKKETKVKLVNQGNIKFLYGTAHKKGISKEQLEKNIKEKFKIKSLKELTLKQFQNVCLAMQKKTEKVDGPKKEEKQKTNGAKSAKDGKQPDPSGGVEAQGPDHSDAPGGEQVLKDSSGQDIAL